MDHWYQRHLLLFSLFYFQMGRLFNAQQYMLQIPDWQGLVCESQEKKEEKVRAVF